MGLDGPPKKATSRLKNSHRLKVLVISSSIFSWQGFRFQKPVETFSSFMPQTNEGEPQ
jgi:hypothetical protein